MQTIYAQNFKTIPLLLVAGIWYLIMTSILTIVQYTSSGIRTRNSRAIAERTNGVEARCSGSATAKAARVDGGGAA